jgi:hypothetical protein
MRPPLKISKIREVRRPPIGKTVDISPPVGNTEDIEPCLGRHYRPNFGPPSLLLQSRSAGL